MKRKGRLDFNPLVYKTFDKAVKANPDAHPLFHSDSEYVPCGPLH